MYVPHHLLPIACAILCLGKSAASTKASGLQVNALPLSVTTVPFQDNATSVPLVDREGQESEERFLLFFCMVFAEFAERLHYWHLNLLERLNVHPSRTLSKFGLSPTASGFSNGVDGLQWLEHAVRYRSKNKKKGKELTDLELFKLLKKRLVHDENLLGVADRLRFQDENAAMKQLSVVFYRALLKDCSPATSKLMLDHWLGSMVVVPDDVFLALGIKVEDLVDHPAVVYQWLRHISEYRKAGSNKYTVEQIKEKLEGASEDQIRKFVDEALKQEDPVLVNMVKEVWGNKQPATVTETAVAT